MKRAALIILPLALAVLPDVALASPPPPPPPPPPNCDVCSGPPPPPTPVATVAPTVVAVESMVDIKVFPSRVNRGRNIKLSVLASTDDTVSVAVKYHATKAKNLRYRVGSSGTLTRTWIVPRSIPVGQARVRVVVTGRHDKVSRTVSVTVVS